MLELENISRSWGAFQLRDISVQVQQGELFVLLGPSGAGKTLLLELIAGFHRPDSGRVCLNGKDVTALPPEERNVGFVYQDQMLFPHRNVRQNMAYGLEVRRVKKAIALERLERLTALLGLERLMDRPATALSGGEKQRVCIARALAIEPDLLLLDEPLSSLDAPERQKLWGELKALHARTRITTIHVTHDRAEAIALAQRIGILQAGRLQQVGTDLSVFHRPNSHFVAEFTGGVNIYRGRARSNEGLTQFDSGGLTLVSTCRLQGPCSALVRPENIIISRSPFTTSARNQLVGTVESVSRREDVCEVTGRFGSHSMRCIITPQSLEELGIAPGTRVCFSFKAGNVHLFDDERQEDADL